MKNEKNKAAVALGKMRTEKKAAAARRNWKKAVLALKRKRAAQALHERLESKK